MNCAKLKLDFNRLKINPYPGIIQVRVKVWSHRAIVSQTASQGRELERLTHDLSSLGPKDGAAVRRCM